MAQSIRNLTGRQVRVASLDGSELDAVLEPDEVVVTISEQSQTTTFAGVEVRTRRLRRVVENLPDQVAQVGLLVRQEVIEELIERHTIRTDLVCVGPRCEIDGERAYRGLIRFLE